MSPSVGYHKIIAKRLIMYRQSTVESKKAATGWATLAVHLGLAIVLILAAVPVFAADIVSTWDGSIDNWTSNHWSSPFFPDNGNGGFTYDAVINSGAVTLDQNITIETLSGSGGTVFLAGSNLLTVGDNTSTTYAGVISGTGNLTKVGAGSLTLTANNSYGGDTYINDGILRIDSGGQTNVGQYIRVGALPSSTASSSLVITGPGSSVSAFDFVVGSDSAGSLTISNGATATTTYGDINGNGQGIVTVAGPNSTWTMTRDLVVGNGNAAEGSMFVTSGGRVNVGRETLIGIIGSNGDVSVTGAGSILDVSSALTVGGSGNGSLLVSDGATVENTNGFLATNPGSQGTATVTGTGSTWNSSDLFVSGTDLVAGGIGVMTVENGGTANVAYSLYVGDQGSINVNSGGQVNVGQNVRIGSLSGATASGSMLITGAGSTVEAVDLIVGSDGAGSLTISAGATATTIYGDINGNGGGIATITGLGSTWTMTRDLVVGNGNAAEGTLVVTSGGQVNVGREMLIGLATSHGDVTVNSGGQVNVGQNIRIGSSSDSTASGSMLITGAGSTVEAVDLIVGSDGAGSLTISAGATATTIYGDINGNGQGIATITGLGSTWTMTRDLVVGNGNAAEGTLVVTGGGQVHVGRETLIGISGSNGDVTVSGADSILDIASALTIGSSSTGSLLVSAGGYVENTNGFIATNPGSQGDVTVTGAGSTWSNSDLFIAGIDLAAGGTGQLTVVDFGTVDVAYKLHIGDQGSVNVNGGGQLNVGENIRIGSQTSATANGSMVLTGLNSRVTVEQSLIVGSDSNGSLIISDRAIAESKWGDVGHNLNGTNGTATVTGLGSTWTTTLDLSVGNNANGVLTVENGGHVNVGREMMMGRYVGSSAQVTVTGTGSTLNIASTFTVGNLANATLEVQSGGYVESVGETVIGNTSTGNGNVTVTGNNSLLNITSALTVGKGGTGSLTVSSGGQVTNTNSFLAANPGSTGNATISGAGSSWSSSDLFVGGGISAAGGTASISVQNGGSLTVSYRTNLWASSSITVNGGTFTTGSLASLSGTPSILLSDPAGGVAMTVGSDNSSSTFGGTIADAAGGPGSLTKIGSGTLTLSGTNTYTGATTINSGELTLGPTATLASTSLKLGGGTFTLASGQGGVNFSGGTNLVVGSSAVAASTIGGAGTLALNNINRSSGTTVNFLLPTTGSITTTTANTAGSIVAGWATAGSTDWAVSASNGTNPGAISALAAYTNDTWAAGNNTTVTTSSSPAAGSTTHSLRFNDSGANTVTLSTTSTSNIITSGGILVTSGVGNNPSTITGGSLSADPGTELVVNQYNTNANGALTISSIIADNGSTRLTKAGPGILILANDNTYSGGTTIASGVLRITSDSNLGATSGDLTFGGGQLHTFGSINSPSRNVVLNGPGGVIDTMGFDATFGGRFTGPGSLTKNGAGKLTLNNNSITNPNTYSSGTTINLGTLNFSPNAMPTTGDVLVNPGTKLELESQNLAGTAFNFGGSGTLTLNGATLEFRNTASSVNTLSGSVVLAASSTITSNGGLNALGQINGPILGPGDLTISGWIYLASANPSFTGETKIFSDRLQLGNSNALVNSTVDYSYGGTLNFGTLTGAALGGLKGNQDLALANQSALPVALSVGNNNASTAYGGVLSGTGSLTKAGLGQLTLTGTNTYTGDTHVNDGTLRLEAGGKVNSAQFVRVGALSGPDVNGSMVVTGTGSKVTAGVALVVGSDSDGSLTISDGGVADSWVGSVGNNLAGSYHPNGVATVTGAGSKWDIGNVLVVGNSANGTLLVENGALVQTVGETLIGNHPTGNGNVSVTGSGSDLTATSALSVGINGAGSLTVSSGGHVTNNNGFIATNPGSTGTVTVTGAGSTWSSSDLFVGGGITAAGGPATLNVSNGGVVNVSDTMRIWVGGTLAGNGTVSASSVISAGRVAPGNSPGILSIDGDYEQTASSLLEIEVGGLTPGTQHDQVQVTGHATLDGTFELPLINGFVPQLNDEITFLTANSISGAPKYVYAPNLGNVTSDLGFVVIKNDQDLRLRFVEPTDIQFVDNTNQGGIDPEDWNEKLNWLEGMLNRVPTSSDIVDLSRTQTGAVERVDVKAADATTHALRLQDPTSPIMVGVKNGYTLSAATGDVTVGQNATLELGIAGNLLNEGTLATSNSGTIEVQEGGLLAGNGTIQTGELLVSGGTLRPGFSVGHLDVDGNYQQGADGTLLVDVEGTTSGQFDTVDVTGDVQLGGTLVFDASMLSSATAGSTFVILTADSLTGTFDYVETVGSPYYIRPIYDDGASGGGAGSDGLGGGSTVGGGSMSGQLCDPGDMDCDQIIVDDDDDIEVFAMALRDIDAFLDDPPGLCKR